jgi:hypothetical protein
MKLLLALLLVAVMLPMVSCSTPGTLIPQGYSINAQAAEEQPVFDWSKVKFLYFKQDPLYYEIAYEYHPDGSVWLLGKIYVPKERYSAQWLRDEIEHDVTSWLRGDPTDC